ncbi:MAG: YciI family protein [Propionibacteriaceae bacterium]
MAIFVVQSKYDHAHDEERLAARPAHREWLMQLHQQGIVINAGPLTDNSGALLIFKVASEQELAEYLSYDPYPTDSLSYQVVGEWQTLFPFTS